MAMYVVKWQLENRPVDLVLSDMAPNLSGMKDIDQPQSIYLIELAYELSTRVLRINGSLLVKDIRAVTRFKRNKRLSVCLICSLQIAQNLRILKFWISPRL